MKKHPAKRTGQKKTVWRAVTGKIGEAAAAVGQGFGTAARQVKNGLSPAARRLSSTAAKVSRAVDFPSVGGAVAGLTAGEILGGIVGGTAGMAVGGPVGAVAGLQVGGLAGGSVGLKLGYDVTHDALHKKKLPLQKKKGRKPASSTMRQQLIGVARTVVKRSGDTVGSGVGALGGAAVGTAVAGPFGGAVGAFVGESLAGDFTENRSLETFDQALPAAGKHPRKKAAPPARKKKTGKKNGLKKAVSSSGQWAGRAMRDAVLESSVEAALAAVGALAAGPVGARLAGRAGLTAAKRVDWNTALADTPVRRRTQKPKASPLPRPAPSKKG